MAMVSSKLGQSSNMSLHICGPPKCTGSFGATTARGDRGVVQYNGPFGSRFNSNRKWLCNNSGQKYSRAARSQRRCKLSHIGNYGTVVSVLESRPRVVKAVATEGKKASILNPAEVLLEKFANMPPSDVSETEAADRLFMWEDVPRLAEKQTFSVYELNEFDRDSPAFLEFSRQTVNKIDPEMGNHIHALGDQVPFTNKLYDCSLKMRLGITAGICLLMKHYPGKGTPDMHKLHFFVPDHYETLMTWHFGDMGHICGQGPFINFQDTLMSVTGGVGFFREARGVIRLHNLTPFKFHYTFTLTGIPKLPKQLTGNGEAPVSPHIHVESHPDARLACNPDSKLPNITD